MCEADFQIVCYDDENRKGLKLRTSVISGQNRCLVQISPRNRPRPRGAEWRDGSSSPEISEFPITVGGTKTRNELKFLLEYVLRPFICCQSFRCSSHWLNNFSHQVKGRVAVITGGGTGLGFIMASTLVVNGAKGILRAGSINIVYITGRRPEKLQESVDKLNTIREGSAIAYRLPRINVG